MSLTIQAARRGPTQAIMMLLLWVGWTGPVLADPTSIGCWPPAPPFVPSDPVAAKDYADLIKRDFEAYFDDVGVYFRCLEQERARIFEEAREVSQSYGQFLEANQ